MSWTIEVRPAWNIFPGEPGDDVWSSVGDNLQIPFDPEFATESEGQAFVRVIHWMMAAGAGQAIGPTVPPREFRVREIT